MVKNTIGGSKTKGQARKHITAPPTNKLRYAESEDEIYAKVTAIFGNGMVEVICIDNKKRLCHIRGKFKGRGKRDNFIQRGSWVLIGKREWESDEAREIKGKIKLPNCDLLEVYMDGDISRLKNTVDKDWNIFMGDEKDKVQSAENEILFTDDNINELLDELPTNTIKLADEEDKINIDDI
jgi:translation initiation factor 1A